MRVRAAVEPTPTSAEVGLMEMPVTATGSELPKRVQVQYTVCSASGLEGKASTSLMTMGYASPPETGSGTP